MNGYREDKAWCEFHPTEVIIGVCPLCLNERLLILAAKQGTFTSSHSVKNRRTLPKLSAFASLVLHRFDFHHKHQFHNSDYTDASTSREDSFISIKFDQDNAVGSWEKSNAVSKVSLDPHCNIYSLKETNGTKEEEEGKRVVEHAKVLPRGGSLRWRKRIGHLFQLSRWKRSSKGCGSGHVGSKLEGLKVRSGWIRTLTKRRTKE